MDLRDLRARRGLTIAAESKILIMKDNYDFSKGIKNPYAKRLKEQSRDTIDDLKTSLESQLEDIRNGKEKTYTSSEVREILDM